MTTVVELQTIFTSEANELLVAWGHRMGPILRPAEYGEWNHVLLSKGEPFAVVTASTLIRQHAGGGFDHLTREDTVELSRLCAARPNICRAMLRLWREFVFPTLGFDAVISYQDAVMHRGDVYRFDGWARSPRQSRSGTDQRTGKKGRTKWLWVWPPAAAVADPKRNAVATEPQNDKSDHFAGVAQTEDSQ